MSKLRIHFVLPSPSTKPGGGTKVMYEYANRLSFRGHEVHIYHAIVKPFRNMRSPVLFKFLKELIKEIFIKPWFEFNPNVHRHIVPDITDNYLPDADVVIGTWWETAYRLTELSPAKGKKFNLIQDLELWKGHEELVYESYKLPITHLVIARYLYKEVIAQSGIAPELLYNAIDDQKFQLTKPIAERKEPVLIMLYSEEGRKGSIYGLETISKLKEEIKDLRLILFSTFSKPDNLSSWIEYHQKPENLAELYNEAKVFLSPSLGEGWALPPAEAMACGCAVVCTRIGGHADYAIDESTALLVEPRNIEDLYQKLKRVLGDDELRCRLAQRGNEFIHANFNWDRSVTQLENMFLDK